MDIYVDLIIQASVKDGSPSVGHIQNDRSHHMQNNELYYGPYTCVSCALCLFSSLSSLTLPPHTAPLNTEGWLPYERGKEAETALEKASPFQCLDFTGVGRVVGNVPCETEPRDLKNTIIARKWQDLQGSTPRGCHQLQNYHSFWKKDMNATCPWLPQYTTTQKGLIVKLTTESISHPKLHNWIN